MTRILSTLGFILAAGACGHAADNAAIVDGPNYAFTVSAPNGWKLTSTKELQAAFHFADTTFEKSAVVMYARSADKKQLHVASIVELNRLDLNGIQKQHPAARSEKVGTVKTALGKEIPLYSFSGGGFSELVAYAEQDETIAVFVLSADTEEQLKAARPAFDALLSSYVALSATRQPAKQPAAGTQENQPVRK